MVSSGLEEKPDYQSRPRVSPYRLTTHLMMATTIYAALLWHSFHLIIKPIEVNQSDVNKIAYLKKVRRVGIVLLKFVLLNIFTGALVAGIDAGSM
jgi:cytochrome c oxidase assembly protein subunit 15